MKHSLNEATDEELMIAYQNGDSTAFDILYRRHSGRVYGFLKLKLKDCVQIDDVFQSAFLKLHNSRHQYNGSLPFEPWLFTICRSTLVDAIRKKTTLRENYEGVDVEALPDQKNATEDNCADLPELSLLAADQRRAIDLRYGQDFSFEEIAKKLETSPANARQLISRAIKNLRSLVKQKRGPE